MQIAIVLFDRFAARDAVVLSETLAALPAAEVALVSTLPGPIRDDTRRLELTADAALHELPRPDVVAIPGGQGAAVAHTTSAIEAWIRTAVLQGSWSLSIAAGSLLAARSGILTDRRVAAPERLRPVLADHGALPVADRAVVSEPVATARDLEDVPRLFELLCLELSTTKGTP